MNKIMYVLLFVLASTKLDFEFLMLSLDLRGPWSFLVRSLFWLALLLYSTYKLATEKES